MRRPCFWLLSFAVVAISSLTPRLQAEDWSRFRGPNGGGVSAETAATPTTWSATQNLKWKVALPGPGSSCPIVVGEKLFVTCWSGYGMERSGRAGEQENLKRHLICLDRGTGKTLWDRTVDPFLPEDDYQGMFAEHGYATHTPVSDGERVYVFFGKTGALAFDLEGKQLWQTAVGTGSDRQGWGSGSSPILYKNLVIVTASPESHAVYGLDKTTGKQVWMSQAEGFASTWGTPILVEVDDKRTDIVLGVPNEIWGLNPETGKLRWYSDALKSRSYCSSVVTDGKLIFAMGDQGSGSIALKIGGEKALPPSKQPGPVATGRASARRCITTANSITWRIAF
ncbi:MAG: PQQ-binding-like beta-propeller repeat protein [Pirellulales bacterium]